MTITNENNTFFICICLILVFFFIILPTCDYCNNHNINTIKEKLVNIQKPKIVKIDRFKTHYIDNCFSFNCYCTLLRRLRFGRGGCICRYRLGNGK